VGEQRVAGANRLAGEQQVLEQHIAVAGLGADYAAGILGDVVGPEVEGLGVGVGGRGVREIDDQEDVAAVVPDVAGDDGRAGQALVGVVRGGHLHAARGADPSGELGDGGAFAGGVVDAIDADRV